jgi:mRNA interferase RelE/StbE
MYRVVVERSAEKDMKRLSPKIRTRAATAIWDLAKNPRPAGSRKLAGTEGDWRIRVGDYRIIYEIADEIRIIRINRVRHRSDVYR